MTVLVWFAVTLFVAVLASAFASRSVLSTAVVFLLGGFLLSITGASVPGPDDQRLELIAELALFSVLFTDGMRLGVRQLTSAWRLPGRALLLGMPLTFLGTALLARWLTGVNWTEAFLLGAALAPTDPVFASAIVGREGISQRLRNLLNVESGLNDGLALPFVVLLLAAAGGQADVSTAVVEVMTGIAIGVGIPFLAIKLEELSIFRASTPYEPLMGFAIGLVVLSVSMATHANLFLAAFSAGVTVASLSPTTVERFHDFGELLTELFKLAALFLLGLLIDPTFLSEIPLGGYLFAVLALVLVRPIAISIALYGDQLHRSELAAAAWFGPKGFASVVYGLLILHSGIEAADVLFHLTAIVVAASIIAHSSTDVLIAHKLADLEQQEATADEATR